MRASDFLFHIRGIPFPNIPWFSRKNIENSFEYIPHDGDIIIASYPKTGTTWLQYIVQQIISRGESLPAFDDLVCKLVPFVERVGIEVLESMDEHRMYKQHLPYNLVQKNAKAKYLYIYRNPADAFVSYYHFFQDLVGQPVDIAEYFDDYLSGNVGFGSYFQHVLCHLDDGDSGNLLLISYEKLHVNRRDEILRIAKFLGEEYFEDLVKDDSILVRIIEHTNFDYMKKNLSLILPSVADQEYASTTRKVNYFRKGIMGDGKNTLSADQLKRLREHVADVMKGTAIADEWLNKH